MVSKYPPQKCGIADYTEGYYRELGRLGVLMIKSELESERANPLHYALAALRARHAPIVHVQYEGSMYGRLQFMGRGLSAVYTPLFYSLLRGRKVVTTVHEVVDPLRFSRPGTKNKIALAYYRWVYRSILDRSDLIFVHTPDTARRLLFYARKRTQPDVRVQKFPCFNTSPGITDIAEAKKAMCLEDKKVLLMFGFMVENKGHLTAIDALRMLPKEYVLVIAGGPRHTREQAYLDMLHRYLRLGGVTDRVVFTGYVPEERVSLVFGAADAVLFPYKDVGQSAALHHALAYMKPIIASDLGAFAEIEARYGAITTFKRGDERALAESIVKTIDEHHRRPLVENAIKYLKEIDGAEMARQLARDYEAL